MADVKITGLPTSNALDGSEVVPIVQAGTTKQATVGQIVTKVDSYTKTESDSALSSKQDKLAEGAFVDGDKTKLDGIETGANKYVLPADVVQDANYTHTDNNYTTTEKAKLANQSGINTGDQDLTGLASKTASQQFTKMQRSTITTANTGSFDLTNGSNDFMCTPTGDITLTFTGLLSGQGGEVILVNTTPQVISLSTEIKAPSGTATELSTAGTYRVSYKSDGTNVYITASGALV